MKAKVIGWNPTWQCHICKTEEGDEIRVDLEVEGGLPENEGGESLLGREVEWDRTHAFLSIAHGVRLCDA